MNKQWNAKMLIKPRFMLQGGKKNSEIVKSKGIYKYLPVMYHLPTVILSIEGWKVIFIAQHMLTRQCDNGAYGN